MEFVGATRAAVVLRNVIGALNSLGVDGNKLRQRTGLTRAAFEDPNAWIPVTVHNEVWQEAERLSNDPLIGLHVAFRISADLHTVLLDVVKNSATLGDATIRMARLGRVLGGGFGAILEIHGDRTWIRQPMLEGPQLCFQGMLCQLSVYGLIGRNLTQQPIRAREIHMMHERPRCADRLAAMFQAPFVFGAKQNAIVMDTQDLHLPVIGSDATQCQALEQQARALLENLPERTSLAKVVTGLLMSGVGSESVEQMADRLCITPRTIARKLAIEGTTYQQLRDELRELRAKEYLRNSDVPATEIGISLGFSDGTAFTRAFKRWTGTTPSAYRQAQRDPRGPRGPQDEPPTTIVGTADQAA